LFKGESLYQESLWGFVRSKEYKKQFIDSRRLQQNAISKCKNKNIMEKAKNMYIDSKTPKSF
jgi:hypothetical protein